MFDAWAHAEAGLDYERMAKYTPQELSRLQLGYLLREHDPEEQHGPFGGGLSAQEYNVARSRRDWLDELERN